MRQAIFRVLAGLLGLGFLAALILGTAARDASLRDLIWQCALCVVFLIYAAAGTKPAEWLLAPLVGIDPKQKSAPATGSGEHPEIAIALPDEQ